MLNLKNFVTLLEYRLKYEMVWTSMPKIFWLILFTFLFPLITYLSLSLSLCKTSLSLSTLSVACLLSCLDQNALSGLNENKLAMMVCFSLLSIVWIGSYWGSLVWVLGYWVLVWMGLNWWRIIVWVLGLSFGLMGLVLRRGFWVWVLDCWVQGQSYMAHPKIFFSYNYTSNRI